MTNYLKKPAKTDFAKRRFRRLVNIEVPVVVRDHLNELAADADKSAREYLEHMVWSKWMDVIYSRQRRAAKAAEKGLTKCKLD